jgi:hypothetical protein
MQARRSEHVVLARTAGSSSRRARGLRVFFEHDLENAFLQEEIGEHLLEFAIILLEQTQALRVRVRHHPELLVGNPSAISSAGTY